MKKAKKPETMKMLIKKIAVVACAATLAFSMIPATVQAAGWKQNKNGYWWQENDYSYPRNQWKTIYGKQYHFNSGGYMDTGWTKVDGRWYYLGARNDGEKKTYWQKVYGKYYWLGSNGVMRTGWQQVYGKYYWRGGSNDGAMKTGWQKVGKYYYWLGHSNDGAMKTGWQTIYGKKYYLGGANDGAMKTGWQQIGRYWYYFGGVNDGSLKTNTWIGIYHVDANGRWDKTKKVDIGEYLTDKKDVQLVNVLGLIQTKSEYGRKEYARDQITYYYHDSGSGTYSHTFGITNEGNKYINIYGIVPGNSLYDARSILKAKQWKEAQENYSGDKYDYLFLKTIGKRSYMIEIHTDSSEIITSWYVMNWPQGDFTSPDNLKEISLDASLDNSSPVVFQNSEENKASVQDVEESENQNESPVVIPEETQGDEQNGEQNLEQDENKEVEQDTKVEQDAEIQADEEISEQPSDESQSAETQKTEEQVDE